MSKKKPRSGLPPQQQPEPVFTLDLDAQGVRAAVPPILRPKDYERFEGFRETTLACFLHPAANVALRTLGRLLYSMVLEYWRYWLSEPEGHFRHQCHAVIADLRHLQGYLARLGREQERLSLEPFEARLSRKCPRPLPADPEDCRRPGKRPGRTAGT